MFDIGASLAAARRARGLGLRDAERMTCMRSKYLTALEEERFDELPGRTYARAFLRTYAAALGLQADSFVAEFDAQHPEVVDEDDVAEFRPRRPMRMPVSVPVVAAVGVVAVLGWSAWTGGGDRTPTIAPPPAAAAATLPPRAQLHAAVAAPVRHVARTLVVRAARGPCWIEARSGSSRGALLARRTLARGESATFAARRVWLRLGAPWNAVVRRGTTVLRLPAARRPVNVAY